MLNVPEMLPDENIDLIFNKEDDFAEGQHYCSNQLTAPNYFYQVVVPYSTAMKLYAYYDSRCLDKEQGRGPLLPLYQNTVFREKQGGARLGCYLQYEGIPAYHVKADRYGYIVLYLKGEKGSLNKKEELLKFIKRATSERCFSHSMADQYIGTRYHQKSSLLWLSRESSQTSNQYPTGEDEKTMTGRRCSVFLDKELLALLYANFDNYDINFRGSKRRNLKRKERHSHKDRLFIRLYGKKWYNKEIKGKVDSKELVYQECLYSAEEVLQEYLLFIKSKPDFINVGPDHYELVFFERKKKDNRKGETGALNILNEIKWALQNCLHIFSTSFRYRKKPMYSEILYQENKEVHRFSITYEMVKRLYAFHDYCANKAKQPLLLDTVEFKLWEGRLLLLFFLDRFLGVCPDHIEKSGKMKYDLIYLEGTPKDKYEKKERQQIRDTIKIIINDVQYKCNNKLHEPTINYLNLKIEGSPQKLAVLPLPHKENVALYRNIDDVTVFVSSALLPYFYAYYDLFSKEKDSKVKPLYSNKKFLRLKENEQLSHFLTINKRPASVRFSHVNQSGYCIIFFEKRVAIKKWNYTQCFSEMVKAKVYARKLEKIVDRLSMLDLPPMPCSNNKVIPNSNSMFLSSKDKRKDSLISQARLYISREDITLYRNIDDVTMFVSSTLLPYFYAYYDCLSKEKDSKAKPLYSNKKFLRLKENERLSHFLTINKMPASVRFSHVNQSGYCIIFFEKRVAIKKWDHDQCFNEMAKAKVYARKLEKMENRLSMLDLPPTPCSSNKVMPNSNSMFLSSKDKRKNSLISQAKVYMKGHDSFNNSDHKIYAPKEVAVSIYPGKKKARDELSDKDKYDIVIFPRDLVSLFIKRHDDIIKEYALNPVLRKLESFKMRRKIEQLLRTLIKMGYGVEKIEYTGLNYNVFIRKGAVSCMYYGRQFEKLYDHRMTQAEQLRRVINASKLLYSLQKKESSTQSVIDQPKQNKEKEIKKISVKKRKSKPKECVVIELSFKFIVDFIEYYKGEIDNHLFAFNNNEKKYLPQQPIKFLFFFLKVAGCPPDREDINYTNGIVRLFYRKANDSSVSLLREMKTRVENVMISKNKIESKRRDSVYSKKSIDNLNMEIEEPWPLLPSVLDRLNKNIIELERDFFPLFNKSSSSNFYFDKDKFEKFHIEKNTRFFSGLESRELVSNFYSYQWEIANMYGEIISMHNLAYTAKNFLSSYDVAIKQILEKLSSKRMKEHLSIDIGSQRSDDTDCCDEKEENNLSKEIREALSDFKKVFENINGMFSTLPDPLRKFRKWKEFQDWSDSSYSKYLPEQESKGCTKETPEVQLALEEYDIFSYSKYLPEQESKGCTKETPEVQRALKKYCALMKQLANFPQLQYLLSKEFRERNQELKEGKKEMEQTITDLKDHYSRLRECIVSLKRNIDLYTSILVRIQPLTQNVVDVLNEDDECFFVGHGQDKNKQIKTITDLAETFIYVKDSICYIESTIHKRQPKNTPTKFKAKPFKLGYAIYSFFNKNKFSLTFNEAHYKLSKEQVKYDRWRRLSYECS